MCEYRPPYRHHLIQELIVWQPNVIHNQCEFFCFSIRTAHLKADQRPIVHTSHTQYERYVIYVLPFERFGRYAVLFLIVGDGPSKEQLQRLSVTLGISAHVIFTGMVQLSEVQDYYQLGDIFVSASTSETQELTYIEAAANGLPLLYRSGPCLKNVIVQGKNGYKYTCEREFLDALHIAVTYRDR